MPIIENVRALEVLDSRGRPTVQVTCALNGYYGTASVPSGASSGAAEAHELRDGDPSRYGGLGCRKAVAHVNTQMADLFVGKEIGSQQELDERMLLLDGTPNKSNIGANAILAVSIAYAKASAAMQGIPLFRYFNQLSEGIAVQLPRPTINLFSGGLHAGGQVAIQDVLVVPALADSIDEALAHTYAVFQAGASLAFERYGYRLLRADEGGMAPGVASAEEMLALAVESIEKAGFRPGKDIHLAIDVASSHFYKDGGYLLGTVPISSEEMIGKIAEWIEAFPIVSVEDGLAEEDWDHWPDLMHRIQSKARVVGDDLLCTNPQRIDKAIKLGAANTLLLKVNQIGTLTEAARARQKAIEAGWQVTISARSGETEDRWLADLAVGWAGHQIKVGSITQSERLAKYNRLLEIEQLEELELEPWPNSLNR